MRSIDVVGQTVLAPGFPYGAVDRRQVVDVDLLGVLVGEDDVGRLGGEHIAAAIGQRDGGDVLSLT